MVPFNFRLHNFIIYIYLYFPIICTYYDQLNKVENKGRSCACFSFPPESPGVRFKDFVGSNGNKMTIDVQLCFERTRDYFMLFYIPYSIYFIALTIKYLWNDWLEEGRKKWISEWKNMFIYNNMHEIYNRNPSDSKYFRPYNIIVSVAIIHLPLLSKTNIDNV